MSCKPSYTSRIRHSQGAAFIALLAMVFQVLFAAEHASAMAAAAARGGADGTPMGFLDICTAQGLIRIPAPSDKLPGQQSPPSSSGEHCAVCGSAATTGAASTPVAASIVDRPHLLLPVEIVLPTQEYVPSAGLNPHRTTRAPPQC